jgi:hypothetical protein
MANIPTERESVATEPELPVLTQPLPDFSAPKKPTASCWSLSQHEALQAAMRDHGQPPRGCNPKPGGASWTYWSAVGARVKGRSARACWQRWYLACG